MNKHFIDDNGNHYESVTLIETPEGHTLCEIEKPSMFHSWDNTNSIWVDNTPPPLTPEEELTLEREGMSCTRQQGKLALGEAAWEELMLIAAAPDMPWGLRVAIQDTTVWRRTDADMQALIWAMNLSETEADGLFRLAATI